MLEALELKVLDLVLTVSATLLLLLILVLLFGVLTFPLIFPNIHGLFLTISISGSVLSACSICIVGKYMTQDNLATACTFFDANQEMPLEFD